MDAWDSRFLEQTSPITVQLPTRAIELPLRYGNTEALMVLVPIDARGARSLLPAGTGLVPIRAAPTRGVLAIFAFDHHESTLGAYGEMIIGILCAPARVPYLPLVAERAIPGVGLYVLHAPVTTPIALEAGHGVWNYPDFLASIRFKHANDRRVCELTADGTSVLRVEVRGHGTLRHERRGLCTYSVRDGNLLRTDSRAQMECKVERGREVARIETGDHAVGRLIASLDPSPNVIESRTIRTMQRIVPVASFVRRIARA